MSKKITVLGFLIWILISGAFSFSQESPKVRLDEISEEEKNTVERLFVLNSEIEYLNTKIKTLRTNIERIEENIKTQTLSIEAYQKKVSDLKEAVKRILIYKQKQGVGSELQMIFQSTSVKELILRINLLRDLSHKSKITNEQLLQTVEKLSEEKQALVDLNSAIQLEESALKLLVTDKQSAKDQLEEYLKTLNEERAYYESYLKEIEESWSELKPMFTDTVSSFNKIIENNELPEDTLRVEMNFLNAVATLEDSKFNEALNDHGDLPTMTFNFKEEFVSLTIPDYNIVLEGKFVLLDPQSIEFVVNSGTFYELDLNPNALSDLFNEGALVFDLKTLLGKNIIRSMKSEPEKIILNIAIKLF